jgi:hypothetical protein
VRGREGDALYSSGNEFSHKLGNVLFS